MVMNANRVIMAKIETTQGIDAGCNATSNAILMENPQWGLADTRMHEQNPVKGVFGKGKAIYGGSLVQLTGEVKIKGSGTANVPPEFAPFLRAGGLSETIGASDVTYGLASSGLEYITVLDIIDGIGRKIYGAVVELNPSLDGVGKLGVTITGRAAQDGVAQAGAASTITLAANCPAIDDVYNGQEVFIYEGTGAGQTRTISDYVGATKIASVSSAWATIPDDTSRYAISGMPFDTTLPTPTYDSTVPVPHIGAPFSVGGFEHIISKVDFAFNSVVSKPTSAGASDGFAPLQLTNRNITGSFDPEAVAVATHNFIGKFKSGESMALDTGTIGTTAGERYRIQMPGIYYRNPPGEGDREGRLVYDVGFEDDGVNGDAGFVWTFS